MAGAESTRLSLLIRLRDQKDQEAWTQFVEIYSPFIFGFARRCGLQESDAADLVQEVMGEVTKSIAGFEYDPQLGKFRSWLYKIAKRTMSRIRQKQSRQPVGSGDSDTFQLIASRLDEHDDVQEYWDREYHRYLIEWAADKIRCQFNESTWQAFWLTSVEERSPQTGRRPVGLERRRGLRRQK